MGWLGRGAGGWLMFLGLVLEMPGAQGLRAWVDPRIGNSGSGPTRPGAALPFGMATVTPIWPADWYGYATEYFGGLGFTAHSGSNGMDEPGPVFTFAGGAAPNLPTDYLNTGNTEKIAAAADSVSPGYYVANLPKNRLKIEATATSRCGMVRVWGPADAPFTVAVPAKIMTRGEANRQGSRVIGDRAIAGYSAHNGNGGWAYTYFRLEFDRAFEASGSESAGVWVRFPAGATVTARCGLSFTDTAGARANLAAEMPAPDFAAVLDRARAAWDSALSVINLTGGSDEERRIFATALYHTLLTPNLISDADGRYPGFDLAKAGAPATDQGGFAIHRADPAHPVYANYSGWDVYRTEWPWLALIAPDRLGDMGRSLIEMGRETGRLDRWPKWNKASGVMAGKPITTMLATTAYFGAGGLRADSALQVAWTDAQDILGPYQARPFYNGDVSEVQEDCVALYGLGHLAMQAGDWDQARQAFAAAQAVRELWDPGALAFRARGASGLGDGRYSEGTQQSYRWLLPQDMSRLIGLMGGSGPFNDSLDHFFAAKQYDAGNEPAIHAPFLYDYSGNPAGTQQRVRALLLDRGLFGAKLDGLPGDDDCGTMSAWWIFASLGLYPVDPVAGPFVLSAPLYPEVKVGLPGRGPGKSFTVRATGASDKNLYIQSASLNGKPLERAWITVEEVVAGGILEVTLGPAPSGWGKANPPPGMERFFDGKSAGLARRSRVRMPEAGAIRPFGADGRLGPARVGPAFGAPARAP